MQTLTADTAMYEWHTALTAGGDPLDPRSDAWAAACDASVLMAIVARRIIEPLIDAGVPLTPAEVDVLHVYINTPTADAAGRPLDDAGLRAEYTALWHRTVNYRTSGV
jgi:hypothetical protein